MTLRFPEIVPSLTTAEPSSGAGGNCFMGIGSMPITLSVADCNTRNPNETCRDCARHLLVGGRRYGDDCEIDPQANELVDGRREPEAG